MSEVAGLSDGKRRKGKGEEKMKTKGEGGGKREGDAAINTGKMGAARSREEEERWGETEEAKSSG